MGNDILSRIHHLASNVLPGTVRTRALGEDYYSFEMKEEDGSVTELPHIWIDSDSSDWHIREKLRAALRTAFHPETLPDDLSVPDLKREEAGI